jgi:hypothetical protein
MRGFWAIEYFHVLNSCLGSLTKKEAISSCKGHSFLSIHTVPFITDLVLIMPAALQNHTIPEHLTH